ncbi:MAG TPA: helix-turn-helix domain-containing protein [Pyrinomonadaceae bacterium]|jgi:cytoskeletal protein RodZ
MTSSFGEQLRLAREARGISLREISEQTRISTRYLEAIEADDYKRLPGGIFNKSFIKAYAKYIGYDEQEALEAYMRTARDQGASPDDVVSTPYQPRVYTDGNSRSPLVTLFLTILILAILSLGIYAALHWYQRSTVNQIGENVTTQPPATNASGSQPVNPNATANTQPVAPTSTAPTAVSFSVQLKALGERVWVKAAVDDEDGAEAIIAPDEIKEFKATERFSALYSKSKARALEVKINGRTANVPINPKPGGLAELLITKDDYERFMQ